jgi:hypothetical protein
MPRLTLTQVISEDRFVTQVYVGRFTWSAYAADLQLAVKHYSTFQKSPCLSLHEFRRQVFPRFSGVCDFVTMAPNIRSTTSEFFNFVHNFAAGY